MKHFLVILLSILSIQYSAAQTASTLKDRMIGKWIYEGTEEFGVVALDSLQKKDWIELNADGNFKRVFMGKEESGTYKITENTRQVFLTDASAKKTTIYKAKYLTATSLTLDYQTPDLVHTLFQFKRSE